MYQPDAAEATISKCTIFKITMSVLGFLAGIICLVVTAGRKAESTSLLRRISITTTTTTQLPIIFDENDKKLLIQFATENNLTVNSQLEYSDFLKFKESRDLHRHSLRVAALYNRYKGRSDFINSAILLRLQTEETKLMSSYNPRRFLNTEQRK